MRRESTRLATEKQPTDRLKLRRGDGSPTTPRRTKRAQWSAIACRLIRPFGLYQRYVQMIVANRQLARIRGSAVGSAVPCSCASLISPVMKRSCVRRRLRIVVRRSSLSESTSW